jgi:hypothetical protein
MDVVAEACLAQIIIDSNTICTYSSYSLVIVQVYVIESFVVIDIVECSTNRDWSSLCI